VVGHDGSLSGEVVHDAVNAVDHAKRADEARRATKVEKRVLRCRLEVAEGSVLRG
jgi:hypothetical protein